MYNYMAEKVESLPRYEKPETRNIMILPDRN